MANETSIQEPKTLADDTLEGAVEIAAFMFGEGASPSRVYALTRSDGAGFPYWRRGGVLCARKSVILAWVAAQEAANCNRVPVKAA